MYYTEEDEKGNTHIQVQVIPEKSCLPPLQFQNPT